MYDGCLTTDIMDTLQVWAMDRSVIICYKTKYR